MVKEGQNAQSVKGIRSRDAQRVVELLTFPNVLLAQEALEYPTARKVKSMATTET